jgi:ankyrin repeat protein
VSELSAITAELKTYIKELDQDKFFELYDTVDDPFEMPECLITELFKHYPEILCHASNTTSKDSVQDLDIFQEEKQNIVDKLNVFFKGLIERGFFFDDNILSKRYDEPIQFFKLYDAIGIDQQNSFGNTILHMQVRGLHYEGVKFLLEQDADPNIFNSLNQNCFEILFLDSFIAYSHEEAYDKKMKIAKLLIDNDAEYNRVLDGKDMFERAMYFTFIENNGQNNWNIDNLIILKNILNYNDEHINIYIDKLIVFITENKSMYANSTLFNLDLANINRMRKYLNI